MKHSLVILPICLVLLASCGSSTDSKTPEVKQVTIDESIATISPKLRDDSGMQSCMATAVKTCSTEAINRLALERNSVETCNDFTDPDLRATCQTVITRAIAKKSGDTSGCDKLTSGQGECIQDVIINKAVAEKNPRYCSDLRGDITGADADTLSNRKDRCVMHVMNMLTVDDNTVEYCKLIMDESVRKSCADDVTRRIEFLKANPQIPSVYSKKK